MKCIRPTQFDKTKPFVSCGQCKPCRIVRKTEWLTKLYLEFKHTKKAVFVTLTYDDANLPHADEYIGGTLVKKDLQDFIKRYRRNYQYHYGEREIRYFAVGEYGDKSDRAHYHLIIYNVDPLASQKIVDSSWSKGINHCADVNVARLKYTVGYTLKKMTGEHQFPDGRQPEFSLKSIKPSLGSYSLDAFAKKLIKRGHYPANALGMEEMFHVKRFDNGIELKLWNGWFKVDKQNYKLDRNMMIKLAEKTDYYIKNYTEMMTDYNPETKKYKAYRRRLLDDSNYARIKFVLSGEQHATQVKSEKIYRNSKKEVL